MGQKLTQTKTSVVPEAETFLYKYLPQFQFVKILSDSIFLKTALCVNESQGEPLVCKIYFKREFNESESQLYMKQVESLREIKELYNIKTSPNVAPILLVSDQLQKAGLIVRQYYSYNLKERMASMPYLSNIEKKWISFQIIYALTQIHNKGQCHGDIKLENVVLNSSGSVFLCDIAPYKPAYIQQDDVGSLTYYFGTNSSIKSCYMAPERLVDKYELIELSNSIYKITTAMDIFSVGAVLAELFLEDMLFDHPKLLLYKNGKFNLEQALKKIKNKKLEQMLLKMMKPNPNERIELSECFKIFAEEIFPISFSRMLIHFNTLIVSADYWKPDKRIGLIYKHWKGIWKVIYGIDCEVPEIIQNLNHQVLNRLILDSPFTKYYIENYPIIFDMQNDDRLILDDNMNKNIFLENHNSESGLIIVNLILTCILNTKYASTKILGMEMLRIFSLKLSDLLKIQLIIPYLVKLLKDTSNLVRYTALNEIITILTYIQDDVIVPSSDYSFFDSFVFPSILELYSSNEPSLILAFANIIDKLTDLEHKFLQITMRSRFHNMKNQSLYINSQARQTFTFGTQGGNNLNKGEEIIQAYDTDLFEFKSSLFRIIEDILSKNDDLDIQQSLIRKLPNLMLFYGRRETNNFSKFIIAHFNKKDWIIQREILKCIPSLIITLGETALNQFIVPCMELIINNNLNELKIYEMIHTMHLLFKMEFLETNRTIDLFKKILPYIMHPNLSIRNEVINFANTLINVLSPGEVYTYLRPEIKQYLSMPFLIISAELIKKVTKERISRVIYELESKNIKYLFRRNEEDEEAFQFLQSIIEIGKEANKFSNDAQGGIEAQLVRLRASLEGISIASVIKKEFLKFTKIYTTEDFKFLEKTFLGKLISLSNCLDSLSFPSSRKRGSVNIFTLNKNFENIITQENFKIKFLLKALDVVVKEEILQDLDENNEKIKWNQNVINNQNKINTSSMINPIINWRPQGRLLNTLFEHDNSPVEKLLSLNLENMNKFLSFSMDGNIMMWDVNGNDNDLSVEKIAQHRTMHSNYSKAISCVDANQFVIANKNNIEVYRIEANKSNFLVQNNYAIKNQDDSDVTCLIGNYKNLDNKNLIYCNQKGKLCIYDLRINKSALTHDIGVQKGLISCMDNSKDDRNLYMGTLGGFILNYDFRLNSIIESFKYNENTPIIGLQTYFPTKLKEYDLYSMNINPNSANNNYLTVWTASNDHEMGLWNINTLNCDILFKVNTLQGKEIKPLATEIPSLTKEENKEENEKSNVEIIYKYLARYTFNTKSIMINQISSDFYSHSNKRLSKLSNLFDNLNTVQTTCSPIYSNENMPYILSAGNDAVIRFWDISKEGINSTEKSVNGLRKSYLVNSSNKIDDCIFSTSVFDSTLILQSNETYNLKVPKKDIPSLSEYQNYNGVNFNLGIQNEFDESLEVLKYCTRISDASHKNIITDLLHMNINNTNQNLLLSSSWDGTIKIWK